MSNKIEVAREIARLCGIAIEPGSHLDPATLDAAWSIWLAQHQRGSEDPNPCINAFGMALGQHLVDLLGLEWKVVQDETGTEMAVWGKEGDIVVFPANLVAKRYVTGTDTFFAAIAALIGDQVRHVRAAAHPAGRDPLLPS